jgi:hypothetical protein
LGREGNPHKEYHLLVTSLFALVAIVHGVISISIYETFLMELTVTRNR